MNPKEILPRALLLVSLAFTNACGTVPVHPTPARRGIEQGEFQSGQLRDWDRVNNIVTVGNTTFRQGQLFSSDPPRPSFPFRVSIDTKAVAQFRQKMADILPPDVDLVINAGPLDMDHSTGVSFLNPSPDGKYTYTQSASFDALVATHVYSRWKNYDLNNQIYAADFAQEVTGQILNLNIHEARHFPHLFLALKNPSQSLPVNVREPTAIAAEYTSLDFAPMIIVSPVSGFPYNNFYNLFRVVETK